MSLGEDKIPQAVRNEWFYLFARACMIFATLIGVPTGGFLLSRVIAKADEISAAQSAQSVDLRLLSAEIKIRFENDNKNITDHELRLRQLERGTHP